MKRMNKVLAKAVVLSLIMGGVHMGGTFVKKAMLLQAKGSLSRVILGYRRIRLRP